MDFKFFDRRNYPVVDVRKGYGQWTTTYEQAVPDNLDILLLETIRSVNWPGAVACLDLACGTGRIGAWLKKRGVAAIDGIDLTPEMLKKAEARKLYRALKLGTVEQTGLSPGQYDLIVMSLVDEHLPTLGPVYHEAARLCRRGGKFVVVGMHPYFFMTGMPTHFKNENGEPIAIETHIHLFSDHVSAAHEAGWGLREMHEGVVDEEWLKVKPKWDALRGHPVNYSLIWARS